MHANGFLLFVLSLTHRQILNPTLTHIHTAMAPGIIHDGDSPINTHPAATQPGKVLDEISDAIDEVNVLKKYLQQDPTNDLHKPSHFDSQKDKSRFRQYESACERVKSFYREQHAKQTVSFNLRARARYHAGPRARMTVWQAMEQLNSLVDESDPDTELSQIEHLLQTAEAMRRDGRPRWMQLTGLVHDLGKLLFFYGAEGQWDVVGDTFPVGCRFDEANIYPETFAENPDSRDEIYQDRCGVYVEGCGLENVMLSWGHDEYMYLVCKEQSSLPEEALAMIRYHSESCWTSVGRCSLELTCV